MSFKITLGIVLSFFVPGLLVFGAGIMVSSDFAEILNKFFTAPTATLGTIFGLIIFVIGAMTDSMRAVVVDPFINCYLEKFADDKFKLSKDYIKAIDKDNLEVFNVLVEHTQTYYRLSANGSLALLFVLGSSIWGYQPPSLLIQIGIGILAVVFLIGAYSNKKSANWAMNQFNQ